MKQVPKHIVLVIIIVVFTGMVANCLFSYQDTVKDIGKIGAFFVPLIFIFIYSIFISAGILLYIMTCKLLKKEYKLYIILITSSLIININYIDDIFKFMSNGWINIIIIYILSTYFLAIILSLFIPKIKLKKKI